MIEELESRIAPAAVLHLTDLDGDKITVTASKGTKADLTAACNLGGAGLGIDLIATAQMAQDFAGTELTVAVKKAGGGNGSVEVTAIHAYDDGGMNNINLGNINIAGDLGSIDAGTGDAVKPAVKNLSVRSLTDSVSPSTINGILSKATVQHDVSGYLQVATIGKMTVGGSIAGGNAANSGHISALNINSLTIDGDVQGGSASQSGVVYADNTMGSLTIKGSIVGGTAQGTGSVAARIIGTLIVNGDLQGGTGSGSGPFPCGGIGCNTFTTMVIKGSLIGGSGIESGTISATGAVANGSLRIGGNVTGGTNLASGSIELLGSIASLTIGGKLDGHNQAAGSDAGAILCPSIGKLSIGQVLNGAQIIP